jgi:hypothetical protein
MKYNTQPNSDTKISGKTLNGMSYRKVGARSRRHKHGDESWSSKFFVVRVQDVTSTTFVDTLGEI